MTGLIYVVIIALWAAVLIPIWLKRHDQISEVRSTARFSSAMKTLGGRVPADTPMPPEAHLARTRRIERSEATMDARHPSRQELEGMDREYERELVRQAAATRRAIVLGSLTAVLLLSLLLAVVGILPRWVPVLAALPVVAFVLATVMTASGRSAEAHRPVSAPVRRRAPVAAPAAPAATEDDVTSWTGWGEESWDAVPTTLPTYVSAPRASAVPREIDRSHPGEWTGQAMVDAARAMRSRPQEEAMSSAVPVDHGAETAEIPVVSYESPRAANQ